MKYGRVYFLGIGGIGMSAEARYFLHEDRRVAGYDRTPSELTAELRREGAEVTYDESTDAIPAGFRSSDDTLVVYTPAIPEDHPQLRFFRDGGFEVVKRSRLLGAISEGKYVMAVAGTHGKTTTTTMAAWFNRVAGGGGSAFLGGISKNFGSNLVLGSGPRLVVEADEFDRSFLQLHPDAAVVTAADADHLDIYGTHEAVKEAFAQFVAQIKPGGALIVKRGVELDLRNPEISVYRYGYDGPCDFYADRIRVLDDGRYRFDLVFPDRRLEECTLGIPGRVNVENCVAAAALLWVAGFDERKLREAIASFSGVRRRFDFYVNEPGRVYMDDYAHHPNELRAAIGSLREMFPGRRLTVVLRAAPLHPHAGFLRGIRLGAFAGGPGAAAADLSGARRADRGRPFRDAAAAADRSRACRVQGRTARCDPGRESGTARDFRRRGHRPLLRPDRGDAVRPGSARRESRLRDFLRFPAGRPEIFRPEFRGYRDCA